MPEIDKIFIGKCGSNSPDSLGITSQGPVAAHAHVCKGESNYMSVCVQYKDDILDWWGRPSYIINHEYAHILQEELHTTTCKQHEGWKEKEVKSLSP